MYDQRLTFHPSHFVKLASLDDEYVQGSIVELELHSQVGFAARCGRMQCELKQHATHTICHSTIAETATHKLPHTHALHIQCSQIFDVMGYDVPSPYNKINIHIGGVYGGKQETLKRFAANVARLTPACRARLTVENDDTPNAFSLEDLLPMAHETGVPLVFDFHHYKFIDSTLFCWHTPSACRQHTQRR